MTPDQRFYKEKMKAIKEAKQNGQDEKAEQLMAELIAYFGQGPVDG